MYIMLNHGSLSYFIHIKDIYYYYFGRVYSFLLFVCTSSLDCLVFFLLISMKWVDVAMANASKRHAVYDRRDMIII